MVILAPIKRIHNSVKRTIVEVLSVTEERKQVVCDNIIVGSMPRATYYILLSISVLIAGFGLIADSAAVVIGAMLVSPLMTPIFGVSLALIRGNMGLLRNALIAEFGGVILAIVAAAGLGFMPFSYEVTGEMLTRTSPTLLDLLVATLAGLAGCLAMVDERMSPVLPGIAMATALTPPLAVCGLCLAFGAYQGAWGAFLLFFANFLAILAVSSTILIAAGFVRREELGSIRQLISRFAGAAVGLLLVIGLLTDALVHIVQDRKTNNVIHTVLLDALKHEPATAIEKILYKKKGNGGGIDILVTARTSRVFSPTRIKHIQDQLDERLGVNTNLIIRCDLTRDISSTGSTSAVVDENLDGDFITSAVDPRVKTIQVAEQALREILEEHPGLYLDNMDMQTMATGPVIIASIQSSRPLIPYEVNRFEKAMQRRVKNNKLRLLVRSNDLVDISSKGRILYGKAHYGKLLPDEQKNQQQLELFVKQQLEHIKDMFVPNIDSVQQLDSWSVRAEVVGPRILKPSEIRQVEKRLQKRLGLKIELSVWSKAELMVTNDEYVSIENFTKKLVRERLEKNKAPNAALSN